MSIKLLTFLWKNGIILSTGGIEIANKKLKKVLYIPSFLNDKLVELHKKTHIPQTTHVTAALAYYVELQENKRKEILDQYVAE